MFLRKAGNQNDYIRSKIESAVNKFKIALESEDINRIRGALFRLKVMAPGHPLINAYSQKSALLRTKSHRDQNMDDGQSLYEKALLERETVIPSLVEFKHFLDLTPHAAQREIEDQMPFLIQLLRKAQVLSDELQAYFRHRDMQMRINPLAAPAPEIKRI